MMKRFRILITTIILGLITFTGCNKKDFYNIDGTWVRLSDSPSLEIIFDENINTTDYKDEITFLNTNYDMILSGLNPPTEISLDSKTGSSSMWFVLSPEITGTFAEYTGFKYSYLIYNLVYPDGLIVDTINDYLNVYLPEDVTWNAIEAVLSDKGEDISRYKTLIENVSCIIFFQRAK